jgi:DNA polymerase-3 subunit epsilon
MSTLTLVKAEVQALVVTSAIGSHAKPPPLVFLDLETTGLNPLTSDIIELAVMKVDSQSLAVLDWFATKVRPSDGALVEPEAAELNGFSPDEWADAPGVGDVLLVLRRFLDGCLVAGHNPGFDWAFLTATFHRLGMRLPRIEHHLLDTASLAWPLLRGGLVSSLSLGALCSFFEISNVGAHHALADVVRTYQLFLRLIGEAPTEVRQ